MAKKYTDKELIEIYKKYANELGKTPTQSDMNIKRKKDKNFPSYSVFHRRFNGQNNLNEICGLSLNYRFYTKEEIINMIKDYNALYGVPRKNDICKFYGISDKVLYSHFTSFKDILISANLEVPEFKLRYYDNYKNMSDENLLKIFKEYYDEKGFIHEKDLCYKNNMPSISTYISRFGSIKNVYNLLNINIPENKKHYFSDYRNYSNDDLLKILKDYSIKIGFPTQRKFSSKNNLPSYSIYCSKFGSFRNALILAEVDIPNSKKRWFDRNCLSDEEMLKLLEYFTNIKLQNDIFLLTNEDINNNKFMPHSSTYNSRFCGVPEAYLRLNINYKDFNNEALEKDMIKKYIKLFKILGRTPNSRDVDEYSKKRIGFYSMKTYSEHFESLYQLQIYCDFSPTMIGKNKSQEDLLYDIRELYESLGRIPTMRDVDFCEWTASSSKYIREFGSFINALVTAGITNDVQKNKCSITPNGNYCRSSYEYDFCVMLENKNLTFTQEDFYCNYIPDFNRRFRFDFKIIYNKEIYFIEIFGLMEYEWYRDKVKYKINLCESNNINLIPLYKEDLINKNEESLYSMLISKINKFKEE